MKKLTIISIILSVFLPTAANAQLISHRGIVKGSYDFWIYKPQERAAKDTSKLPLVIFLHGKSLSGSNLDRVREYGPLEALKFGRRIEALILAPQTQGGWTPSKIKRILDWTEAHYPVDTNRVYVFGMSM